MDCSRPTEIVIAAFNARYAHASFGARYLLANLGELQAQSELLEFDIQVQPRTAVEHILAHHPRIVSIGCYIWNIELVTKVAALLKSIRPGIKLILGGPEISYETEEQQIFQYADHVICGEGEIEFPRLCRCLLEAGDTAVPPASGGLNTTTVPPASGGLNKTTVPPASSGLNTTAVPPASSGLNKTAVPPASSGLPQTTKFNPYHEIHQTRRKNLPHWTQDGSIYFVTFRLADSIPQSRIKEYEDLREKWEEHHQPPYSDKERERFNDLFSERVNEWLDAGAGSCCLRDAEVSKIAADTLTHFNGERYELDEWVVMPNHVHVLVKPLGDNQLADILHSWKSFSANRINRKLGKTGSLWKKEYYDHMVRNLEELDRVRKYIRDNPDKAGILVSHSSSLLEAGDTTHAADVQSGSTSLLEAGDTTHTADILSASESPLEAGGTAVPPTSSRLPAQPHRIIKAAPVDPAQIELPYALYSDEDIAHRAIYVEASRGCPFRCEYCMSSLDPCVRYFPEETLFAAFQKLLDRGARSFKFVDRTFNIDMAFVLKVLAFFRDRYKPGMMLHFEVIPDPLPDELMEAAKPCPPGMLQFEIGIQTFNEEVAHRIQRPLDIEKIEANIRRLREETGVHIHSDLIAGLPGEDLESFEAGFNRLIALNPQEIQLGILKRLRGAPIDRHSREWKMVYSTHAPYEILQTNLISFEQMQRVQRFARYWNLTVNNGQFIHSAPLIWQPLQSASGRLQGRQDAGDTAVPPASCGQSSPFAAFMEWSDWLYAKTGTTGNLHMLRLAKLLMEFLVSKKGMAEITVAQSLWHDYRRGNRCDVPGFLKNFGFEKTNNNKPYLPTSLPRQSRHLQD
jgi:radical SAM superfamily enzyme YgiQ (UPF0313 family)/REP element-mobilizing transposase RayT